jgi:hypothetical protein
MDTDSIFILTLDSLAERASSRPAAGARAEALDHPSPALIVTRDYLRLVQAFAQIGDRDLRQAIIALVERLATQA